MGAVRHYGVPVGITGLVVTFTAGMILAGRGADLDDGGLLCAGIALAVAAFAGAGAGVLLLCRKRDAREREHQAELHCLTGAVTAIGQRAGVSVIPEHDDVVIPMPRRHPRHWAS